MTMKKGSDYQISIALMCRDFLTQVSRIPGLEKENGLLDRITSAIIEEGDEDLFHIANLEKHMSLYTSRLLSKYSREPHNIILDSLFRRAESLREMCTNLRREFTS